MPCRCRCRCLWPTSPTATIVTRAFFDNLLQERDGAPLNDVMAREGGARHCRPAAGFGQGLPRCIVGAAGRRTSGEGARRLCDHYYRAFSDEKYDLPSPRRCRNGWRLPAGTTDPSPLAGVQGKLALIQLPDGRLAEPIAWDRSPTTHILKVPDREHPRDAAHEAATLDLSRALGFETSEAAVIEIGEIEVLLVRRFDRALDREGRIVRLHQEDFAQALGLPSLLKYERRGTADRRFDVAGIRRVLDATANPIDERDRFIRATLFDLMTGNVDGHAKNFALLHIARDRIRVAPRYDLLPTRLDPNLTDELAFRIGSAGTLAAIGRADFDAFLATLGVRSAAARRRITERHARSLADGLCAAFEELQRRGDEALCRSDCRQSSPTLACAWCGDPRGSAAAGCLRRARWRLADQLACRRPGCTCADVESGALRPNERQHMTEPSPSASVLAAGLKGRCPRCGRGALFRRGLALRDTCERCGQSYAFADSGDGPAVFAIFILGFLILGGALIVEFRLHPPVWVHVLLWGIADTAVGVLPAPRPQGDADRPAVQAQGGARPVRAGLSERCCRASNAPA